MGLLRWEYSANASVATAQATTATFRGDLLVVLIRHGIATTRQKYKCN